MHRRARTRVRRLPADAARRREPSSVPRGRQATTAARPPDSTSRPIKASGRPSLKTTESEGIAADGAPALPIWRAPWRRTVLSAPYLLRALWGLAWGITAPPATVGVRGLRRAPEVGRL